MNVNICNLFLNNERNQYLNIMKNAVVVIVEKT